MGSVFGRVSEETPPFELVRTAAAYEVRRYAANNAIETTDGPGAFMVLAGYIGVMKKAENADGTAISMTAPVICTKTPGTMQFVLPAAVTAPPAANNAQVKIVQRPEVTMAVATFFGGWDEQVALGQRDALISALQADGTECDAASWEWRRFNPPWTLPPYKKNEICVPLR
ncbi:SOUL hem-binding protein [Pelagophyceae sp. CCMP2097]|nr:SOUL hem-binding protein [Pelagophyceae sp. CCMP2097]